MSLVVTPSIDIIVVYIADTAYAKNHYDHKWYNFDDSHVAATAEDHLVVSLLGSSLASNNCIIVILVSICLCAVLSTADRRTTCQYSGSFTKPVFC